MNTISIDSSLYNSTAQYAQQHHMNINQLKFPTCKQLALKVLKIKLLLSQIRPKHEKVKSVWDTEEYQNAMAYLDTLSDKSGKPVPADEDGRNARTEKYAL